MVVCVGQGCTGVVVPAVVLDELRVLVLVRILLSPHEEHMLEKMGNPLLCFGIESRTNVHIK